MAAKEKPGALRLSQYKTRRCRSSQEERRKFLLEQQKHLRNEAFNEVRNIVEDITNSWQKPPVQRSKIYRKKLMLSEWLLDIPSDFQEKWIMVPCPVGKRVLISAGKGMTIAVAKDGRVLSRFKSSLPGGHRKSDEPSKGVTLLDCIWSKCNRSYYILDVLAWNNQSFINCEANFRFYWLSTKLSEGPDLMEISEDNAYAFHSLPTFPCDRVTLETALSTHLVSDVIIDGLLFYHSDADYTAGRTPLVGWLKPFMMCDMMQIHVTEELLVEQPKDYIGYAEFIKDYEERRKKKSKKPIRISGKKLQMEVDLEISEGPKSDEVCDESVQDYPCEEFVDNDDTYGSIDEREST